MIKKRWKMWAYKNKEIERIVLSGLEKIDLGLGPGWGGGGERRAGMPVVSFRVSNSRIFEIKLISLLP